MGFLPFSLFSWSELQDNWFSVSKEAFLCDWPPSWNYSSSSFRHFGSFVVGGEWVLLYFFPWISLQGFLILLSPKKPFFVPVYIPGKRNVLADQGSRQEPLVIDGMLDPELGDPHPWGFLFSHRWTSFCFEPHFEIIFLLFSLLRILRHPKGMPGIALSTGCFFSG